MRNDQERTYPLRQPPNHKPPVPRWTLDFPDEIEGIFTIYIGVQKHDESELTSSAAIAISKLLEALAFPGSSSNETFSVVRGHDLLSSTVQVFYYTTLAAYQSATQALDIHSLYKDLSISSRASLGLWVEHFTAPISRCETNFTGTDYRPGLAALPFTTLRPHDLTAYWGAARDRIPAAAFDRFEAPESSITAPPSPGTIQSRGKYLKGTNYEHACHIRSGQYWEACGDAEREAYERNLEPVLLKGLQYLWDNDREAGAVGLRFMRNVTSTTDDQEIMDTRRETCGAGFFRNLRDLEAWSELHKSHLAIFNGAIRHAQKFGAERKMRTWHEISVFKKGEVVMEYVNCAEGTGAVGLWNLESESLEASA